MCQVSVQVLRLINFPTSQKHYFRQCLNIYLPAMKIIIALFFASLSLYSGAQVGHEEALDLLIQGNKRFIQNAQVHPHEGLRWRSSLENGQHPFAIIVGCSDSRVPPELIFDQGFGDVFVIRLAGNVIDTDAVASIEYAVDHLGTSLIVVLGHTKCGAVTAAVDKFDDPEDEAAEIVSLLYQIEPAIISLKKEYEGDQKLEAIIKNNVHLGIRRLSRVPKIRPRVKKNDVAIVGMLYDMHTGKVNVLEKADLSF